MIVKIHADVEDYFLELIEILYDKEYFGFKESATKYVRELLYEIKESLWKKRKKEAPEYFKRYGYGSDLYYVSYRRSRNTQWYVFFTINEDTYYVNFITNNHTAAQFL